MKTLFQNGFVYSEAQHAFIRTDLMTENGVITDISLSASPDEDTAVIDCEGMYILPGLVDVHTHGRAGYDFNTADADGCRAMRRSYAEAGTTTILATLASAEPASLDASIEAIQKNRVSEEGLCHIAGIHLEGRYLNPKRRGAHPEHLLAPLDPAELKMYLAKMQPAPMRISAAFEMEGGKEFAETAVSMGAVASLAHSDATYEQSLDAVRWGITGFTHTFNTMKPLHHREPGNIAASLLCDTAYTELICDGEHIHPDMIRLASRVKEPNHMVLITDSMEAAGCPNGNYSIAGLHVIVKNGIAVNEEGVIAGSTLDLFTALVNYMSFTDKTLEEALPAATVNPARMSGLENVCGSIAVGLRADFIMIRDKNAPELESVWIAGKKI
ncbi:MAG: N-acetylglucosamine-6-phosphate deacetylase [Clostridia bacterium]|nr:N-acetylglucosamine-6-phosphate deacetylase [Clostridia bacterium]